MNLNDVIKKLEDIKILPVIKINDDNKAVSLANALIAGNLEVAEITFRSEYAASAIYKIKQTYPEMVVAAGTIINTKQADKAIQAGADFLISPGISEELIRYCEKKKYVIIPGISTASEAQLAVSLGIDIVKFFPAETSGGIEAIKAISAPFPNLKFIPTGGINENNINMYLKNRKVIACGGSWMVKEALVDAEEYEKITELVVSALKKVSVDQERN